MNILLFSRCKSINGTQTMILRMARFFNENNHNCYFFALDSNKDFLKSLSNNAKIITLKTLLKDLKEIDVIYNYTEEMLYLALFFRHIGLTNAKIFAGIYHPRQFFSSNKIRAKIAKTVITSMPENLVFMNNVAKESHEEFFNYNLSSSHIIPVPINVNNDGQNTPSLDNHQHVRKIISIGRLVDFKQGPLFLIDSLKHQNFHHKYEYHIYGEGPLKEKISEKINACNLNDSVFLHGQVPYSQLNKILESAFIFYGMGTSLLEACSNSIPSILEIESDKEGVTYGLFHNLKGYEIGESMLNQPKHSLSEILLLLDQIKDSEYRLLCSASKTKALMFDQKTVGNSFINLFLGNQKTILPTFGPLNALKYLLCRIQDRYFYKDGDK